MNIENYFNYNDQTIRFTRHQASTFAKGVAGDFNPIHDEDARRFCVPGDLLFSVFLAKYGIRQEMKFEFSGMVNDTTVLISPEQIPDTFSLQDDNAKDYMDVIASGASTHNADFIAALSEKYVQFSSKTFPDILVPLMEQEKVMINPARPLVIYKNMEIYLDNLEANKEASQIDLSLTQAILKNKGKKAEVRLEFSITDEAKEIGHGAKNLLLSGLREYDAEQLSEVIDNYAKRKQSYLSAK